jgi:membrane-associated protein
VVRTFAPFVAGVSGMSVAKFQFFNITGALIGWSDWSRPAISSATSRDPRPPDVIVLVGVGAAAIPVALGALYKFIPAVRTQLMKAGRGPPQGRASLAGGNARRALSPALG